MRKAILAATTALGLLTAGHASATAVTNPYNSNNIYNLSFSKGNESAFGALITTTSATDVLNDFTFEADTASADQYKLYVYQFQTSTKSLVGNSLFTSGTLTTKQGYNTYNFGSLNLADNTQYLIMMSDSGFTNSAYNSIRGTASNVNASYYTNSTATPSSGEKFSSYVGLGFVADLSSGSTLSTTASPAAANDTSTAVPEPGFMVGLLGLAFLGMVGFQRRMASHQA